MNFETKIESGLQCVIRLIHRPSVQELDRDLFFKELQNTDIVEIQYSNSSGVAVLLTKLIAKCLLPSSCNGLNMHVILVNTENQFQVSQLVRVMRVEACDVLGPTDVGDMVKNILNNLRIINCYNHHQVLLTLNSLDDLLLQNKKVGLVVIDSASAYFWQNKTDLSYNSYLAKILTIIEKKISYFKVLTLYTKQFNFISKKQTREWLEIQKLVRYELSLDVNEKNLICTSRSGKNEKQISYVVDNLGIMRLVEKTNNKSSDT
ncbi:hypothetical protein QAD02_018533 [Eretmocerus hayati]|uniref:Uncharacterized protein n=1 Tax=Eretmocerus hayati TaxID=131215 RepID=A0ACC2PI92_9HYME|nr:hypothetical protein QAD02_018533 [Eretmocerus hayati]